MCYLYLYKAVLHKNSILIFLTLISMHFEQAYRCFYLVLCSASYVPILIIALYIQFSEKPEVIKREKLWLHLEVN